MVKGSDAIERSPAAVGVERAFRQGGSRDQSGALGSKGEQLRVSRGEARICCVLEELDRVERPWSLHRTRAAAAIGAS